MTKEFMLRDTVINLTADIHDISSKLGYHDFIGTDEILFADIETYEHLMKRDENMIDSLIETFMDDIENNIEDADLAADATDIIERLNNLRKEG